MTDYFKDDNDKMKNKIIGLVNKFCDGDVGITDISYSAKDITPPNKDNGYDINPPETRKLTIEITVREIKRVK